MSEERTPTLYELRAKAHALGYGIHYPGIYAQYATVYGWTLRTQGKPSITVDMSNASDGLRKLAAVIKTLEDKKNAEAGKNKPQA